jgi:hypothetical protein
MVARGADGIFRTEPHETHSNGGALPVTADDGQDWWTWVQDALDKERAALGPWIERQLGMFLSEWVTPLERQIKELELRLATLTGAIDVLRGRGAPGSFNVKGTFIADAVYLANDVVAFNGSSFVALKDRPGACPGDGWQLLASAGKRGARGERGLQGPCGKVRWLGLDTEKMTIKIMHSDGGTSVIPLRGIFSDVMIDRENYCIVIKMADGAEWRFSVREFFEQFNQETRGY